MGGKLLFDPDRWKQRADKGVCIVVFYYRLETQHIYIYIYQQIDNILEFWQHVSAVKNHHQAKI